MGQDNGSDNKGTNRCTSELTIIFDHATFALNIKGNIENFDVGLTMARLLEEYCKEQKAAATMATVLRARAPMDFDLRRPRS